MSLISHKNLIDKHRVWYLLLNFGVGSLSDNKKLNHHFRIVNRECKKLGIKIRRLYVDGLCRYLFRFLYFKRNDSAAIRFAESFLYGVSLVNGPMIEPNHDSLVQLIPDLVVYFINCVTYFHKHMLLPYFDFGTNVFG